MRASCLGVVVFTIRNQFGSFLARWEVSGGQLVLYFTDDQSEAYVFEDREAARAVVSGAGSVFALEVKNAA